MAKAKTTKKTKTAIKSAKTVETKTTSTLRKGALAYLGLYGFAAERATKRAEQVKAFYAEAKDGLFEDLVARGEKVEELALGTAKIAQKRAFDTFGTTADKVKAVVPFGANDRVEELESEVEALTKKIAALSKKAASSRKSTATQKAAMATEKTVTKAA